ncbi:ATP-binding protein [Marinoscillum sp.]|uniref:sensor histidine kinase n=1 Tax=Marinoscillum sp. TaxID=2024838 RepID=UPI003BACDD88
MMRLNEPIKNASIYIVLCGLYILFSDKLVQVLVGDSDRITLIQSAKGLVFVAMSGWLIYTLTRRSVNRFERNARRYELIFESMPLPCVILDFKDLTYLHVNRVTLLTTGYTMEDYLHSTPLKFAVNVSAEELTEVKHNLDDSGYVELQMNLRRANGQIMRQQLFCQLMNYMGKKAICVVALDLTLASGLEQEVMERMVAGIDSERQMISGEIHDSIKQYFALIHSFSKTLVDNPTDMRYLEKIRDMAESGMLESRKLSHRIMPMTEQSDFDLEESLSYLVENFNMADGIHYSMAYETTVQFDYTKAINIYRIVQESLNNIEKHSGASEAHIHVGEVDGKIKLHISDNGKGFDIREKGWDHKSLGMSMIRTRCNILDASYSINSEVNKGTAIDVWMPIPLEEAIS